MSLNPSAKTKNKSLDANELFVLDIRIKSNERDCPRCKAVLVLNENEQCYECHNCGYIDCGDDD